MLCPSIVYDSIVELIAPNLLRAHQEDTLSVSLQEHKIGIIMKNQDQEPTILLQVELNSVRAKKKPLSMSDVNLLKVCLLIIFERLQKFLILTQTGTKRQGLDDVISFVMKTCRYESHKDLCRNLEEDLQRMEQCSHCNVLFEDRGSR